MKKTRHSKIPTGCHDCKYKEGDNPLKWVSCTETHWNVDDAIKNKTFHKKCPHKETWDMQHKLEQL